MESLYVAEDGEIKLFEADTRYVALPLLPGGALWRENYRPELLFGETCYERIEPITARLEKGIRRLLSERDVLGEELAYARKLIRRQR